MCACSVAASFSTGTTICTSGSCIARYCAALVRSAGRARVSGCGMVATFMVASIPGAVFKPALSPHIWPECGGLPLIRYTLRGQCMRRGLLSPESCVPRLLLLGQPGSCSCRRVGCRYVWCDRFIAKGFAGVGLSARNRKANLCPVIQAHNLVAGCVAGRGRAKRPHLLAPPEC